MRQHAEWAEAGNAAIVTLLAILVTLFVFLMATNFIVDQYAQGVLRTAVDEGARAGSLEGAPAGAQSACQAKERQVMSGLLAGSFAAGIRLDCALDGGEVVATASGKLPAWLPPVPAVPVHSVGTSILEVDPSP